MANRRNQLVIGGVALIVALIVAVVVWRADSSDTPEATQPTTVTDATTETTASSTPEPSTTSTSFMAAVPVPEPAFPTSRDAKAWPFAWDSIWNLPLGSNATRVPANMNLANNGVGVDENVLILDPAAPKVDLLMHEGGWDPKLKRCAEVTDKVLFAGVPVPTDFVTDPGYLGATPNHASAVLLADGETLLQTQPMHRCEAGGPLISQYLFPQDSLHSGSGLQGAHGGSQMSSIGGTIRLGELVPGGAIRHALKLNIDCESFCSYNAADPDGKPGYRWPASSADREAPGRYKGTVPALQMGSLLALPTDFNVDALKTEPARMVARAMMHYGAYVVDDTHYPIFSLTTEWSPNGRVIDEFDQAWGFSMHDGGKLDCADGTAGCAWVHDFATIVAGLQVIDNNDPAAIGGGGSRLVPCAPAFSDGAGGAAACTTT